MSKKLPIGAILKFSADYMGNNVGAMVCLTVINFFMMLLGLYCWKTIWIWPAAAVYYVFWSYFFRWYFNRKPYLLVKPIVSSMVPSSKILVLGAVFATILVVLPFAPLFMGLSPEFNDRYMRFLQKYMQESDLVDLGLNVVLVLFSPLIFYRPFLAWISALTGRSGSLRSAWARTEGNYWEFLLMALLFNFGVVAVQQLMGFMDVPLPFLLAALSPLVIYYNVVMAKSYEFFYMEIE